MNCGGGLVFDPNLKNCTLPQNNTLSYIFGNSSWVTAPGNLSAVLAERAAIIAQSNGTNYTICSRATPYFDGVHCISCPQQFNLTSRLCVNVSNGSIYDPNLHAYVPIQHNYSTNPNATNYISNQTIPNNTNATYCNISAPFFDGKACVNCSSVFPYFDVATLTCVQCSPYKYYDNVTHSCVSRPLLWISVNFTNLMSSNNTTLASYQAMLYSKVSNNGQAIVQNCPVGQYSNLTHCFPCGQGLYFDISNLTCAPCNGTINSTDLHCIPNATLLTNLNSSNLIVGNNQTLANYSAFYKTIAGPVAYCNSSFPYAVNGTTCIACNGSTPYFNLSNASCVACPHGLVYDSLKWMCLQAIYVSNLAVLNHSNVIQNATLNLTILEAMQINNANGTPVINCSASQPLYNGTHCIACPNGTYYLLSNLSCYTPQFVSNTTALNATNRYVNLGSYNLINLAYSINSSPYPSHACPATAPLYNGSACVACANGTYYDLKSLICISSRYATNITALNATGRYWAIGQYNLTYLQA
jgi:hypothetical protein